MKKAIKALFLLFMSLCFPVGCEDMDELDDGDDGDVGVIVSELVASNGFIYPLSSMTSWSDNNFAACGSYYFAGMCHNGADIVAAAGTTVYTIAAGTILATSGTQNPAYDCPSGWGYDYQVSNTCNMAVAVQHYDDDGNPFVVIYGHLRYVSSYGVGTMFQPGQAIGVIGRYYHVNGSKISADHLHWGVRPGTNAPTTDWGRVSCSVSQPAGFSFPAGCGANGYVAPGSYMNTAGRNWVAPPFAPMLVSPSNASCPVTNTVTFSWVNGSGTYRSMLMVCRNSSLTTGCINPDGGAVGVEPTAVGQNRSTSYTITLSPGTWYWAVRGIAYNDYGGWGSYSLVRTLTTP